MQNNDILSVLSRSGVLLNTSIRFWRASKKLKAEDLGLDPDTVTNHLISLGHKKLVPREALKNFALIESRAHALVDSATFPFLGGIARYLPNAKLGAVTARLEGLEQEFVFELSRFKAQYSSLRVEAAREWWDAARRLVNDPDRLVATIEASMPQAAELDRYFSFNTHLFQVAVPEKSSQLELIAAADQQAIADARDRAAQEAARKIRTGAEVFVSDCVATLRQETAKLCDDMLDSMSAGKTQGVHQKTLNRLVRFVDQFKELNFAGDREMEEQLERVRREFLSRTAEEYRDSSTAQARLRTGLGKLRDTARELAHQDASEIVASFGQMGVRRFNLAA
ncbi:MAG: hypothetical protein HN341_08160 [Verrucomicrobia bacterium]|nr:hypothetical protein [Verrucomicrobiota bacterium]